MPRNLIVPQLFPDFDYSLNDFNRVWAWVKSRGTDGKPTQSKSDYLSLVGGITPKSEIPAHKFQADSHHRAQLQKISLSLSSEIPTAPSTEQG